ncbi:MAG: YdcH family protein [Gammaproteobacteria bacterium]|nr:YdcH family protein [Gammaproteobacteria bacterium]
MSLSHHPLVDEFPEHKDTIHQLKLNNPHFRRLTHEYEGLDKSIVRAEQGIETMNDDYLSEIKKERLHLKDIIYQMIKNPT